MSAAHPLDPLTPRELEAAVAVVRSSRPLGTGGRIVSVELHEPAKDELRRFAEDGAAIAREAHVVVMDGAGAAYEGVVSLDEEAVVAWDRVEAGQPPLTLDECAEFERAVKADPGFQAALAARGIHDLDLVIVDAEPIGELGPEQYRDRRIVWGAVWSRMTPGGNAYSHPVEGIFPIVDLHEMRVLEIEDHGVVPVPPTPGNLDAAAAGPPRTDLRSYDIAQPDGPSYEVDGWEVRWQRWRFRIGFTPREGLVLHTVGYEDQGRVRSILHRASYSEMFVPYGDPRPSQYRRAFFDIGEVGAGVTANSLAVGCECLGHITYFDGAVVNSAGEVVEMPNVVCLHEEDYGLLWKHYDGRSGANEVRRSRRLVVSSIATIANYDYGFYWYLYQDGTIETEVKLTGILAAAALHPGERPDYGRMMAPQLSAPHHQHVFSIRLDLDVDGPDNSVYEVHTEPEAAERNPHGNAFRSHATLLRTESEAQQLIDPLRARHWRIVNGSRTNWLGEPVAYRLVPGENALAFAHPESLTSRRAGFMYKHLWVTPYDRDERYAAGKFPNQHANGGDGLHVWTRADRGIDERDVVLWYTACSHHVARPEEWPVMPVSRIGFALRPDGFFDGNPALDVPAAEHS